MKYEVPFAQGNGDDDPQHFMGSSYGFLDNKMADDGSRPFMEGPVSHPREQVLMAPPSELEVAPRVAEPLAKQEEVNPTFATQQQQTQQGRKTARSRANSANSSSSSSSFTAPAQLPRKRPRSAVTEEQADDGGESNNSKTTKTGARTTGRGRGAAKRAARGARNGSGSGNSSAAASSAPMFGGGYPDVVSKQIKLYDALDKVLGPHVDLALPSSMTPDILQPYIYLKFVDSSSS